MHNFQFNQKREETLLVGDANAISFLGPEGPRVLSTPNMILGMEQTCRNLLVGMLEPGHDSVGTHVNVAHKSAAPMGSSVVFSAELIEVNERRAEFQVAAHLNGKVVGDGFHQRAIIDVRRFAGKVASDNSGAKTC